MKLSRNGTRAEGGFVMDFKVLRFNFKPSKVFKIRKNGEVSLWDRRTKAARELREFCEQKKEETRARGFKINQSWIEKAGDGGCVFVIYGRARKC